MASCQTQLLSLPSPTGLGREDGLQLLLPSSVSDLVARGAVSDHSYLTPCCPALSSPSSNTPLQRHCQLPGGLGVSSAGLCGTSRGLAPRCQRTDTRTDTEGISWLLELTPSNDRHTCQNFILQDLLTMKSLNVPEVSYTGPKAATSARPRRKARKVPSALHSLACSECQRIWSKEFQSGPGTGAVPHSSALAQGQVSPCPYSSGKRCFFKCFRSGHWVSS